LESPPGFETGDGGFADFVGFCKLLNGLALWSLVLLATLPAALIDSGEVSDTLTARIIK
jgi:hydrogenase-4 membrane subunit HyfE